MSHQVYARTQGVTESPRATEYRLLAQVTYALTQAKEDPANVKKTSDAVLSNMKLWNAFVNDLSHPGNQLPKDLKSRLISLGLWVVRECHAVLDGKGDIDAMILVNRNIMQGLQPAGEEARSVGA
ncbi:MAG TPA: flagellar biosynthesis regulator FlaF [Alphaproteobacteria bacterium]